ncbi:drug/metabolite transporter (DMT)-like permease [Rhodobacteraceae bacterium MBR-64]|jgi:drug/metabolite transporter (DMT)-like permease
MSPLRGIVYKLMSVVLFITMASLIKASSGHVPPGEAVFFRSLFAMPVIVGWLALRRELRTGFYTANPLGHFWRGLVGTSAMGLGFTALGLLPLPEATAIGYAAPLLTVVFAAMFLGERVRAFRLTAVGLGMIGVLIVLSPRLSVSGRDAVTTAESLGALVALTAAGCVALAQVFTRRLVRVETTSAIVFWFSVTATVLSLLTLPFGWVVPTAAEAVQLVLAGFLGGVGQIFLTSAYRHAEAGVVAPFDYASMLFAIVIGYFVFGEVPTLVVLGGAAVIILAGVLIIWRERQLGIERDRQNRARTP